MAQTYVPVARYRTSSVTNGGTTVQNIYNQRVVAASDTLQADIGGTISFKITIPSQLPVAIPPLYPNNPNTT